MKKVHVQIGWVARVESPEALAALKDRVRASHPDANVRFDVLEYPKGEFQIETNRDHLEVAR